MATLLHHIHSLLQKSIAEVEDQIEKKVVQQTDKSIQAVHQHLGAFELRVLACPTPTIDLMTLQEAVVSLRAYVDAILYVRVPEAETAPAEIEEDTVLAALFTTTTAPPPPPCELAKRHRSSHTSTVSMIGLGRRRRRI